MRSHSHPQAKRLSKPDLYEMYETSVQSPDVHVDLCLQIYRDIHGGKPRHLREDFCGTFAISTEWIKRDREHTALAVDLSAEVLRVGCARHRATLSSEQKSRLQVWEADVLRVGEMQRAASDKGKARWPRSDLVTAGNFSFYVFKERARLRDYFRSARKGLHARGLFILEMAGGPGMIETTRESKGVYLPGRKGRAFTYVWDQKSFDPITHDAKYAIHFRLRDGKEIKDAFEYDWRLWTIPEVKEVLLEAGFTRTEVYWETEHKGEGTGEYVRTRHGDNAYSWIAYVVGIK